MGFRQKRIPEFIAGFFDFAFYLSYGRNYLFGGMPSPNVGGPLSVIRVFDLRDHQDQNRSMQFLWDDVTCYIIEKYRENTVLVLHGK